ncbi:hypothetical protein BDB01DRAFT_770440 [Pilobolus umbonatus]|nr:hypothetical protein BDB01DRAFT_770440 [Pilobolus umbonatus]
MPIDEDDDRTHMLAGYEQSEDHSSVLPASSRTQHGLTQSEMIQGIANRFMYSNFYIVFYLCLAILSFITIIMSSHEKCPSILFIVFEAVINAAMIIEVSIRILALRRDYWNSVWNIIDTILVVLCAITLIVLTTGCSTGEREEAMIDTLLLVIRNVFQLVRLFIMLRKNQYSIHTRANRVDFDGITDARHTSVEFMDFDREREINESFLDDDSDIEHGRM